MILIPLDGDQRARLWDGRLYRASGRRDTTNHLIVAHEVTNVGTDKSHLANMAN